MEAREQELTRDIGKARAEISRLTKELAVAERNSDHRTASALKVEIHRLRLELARLEAERTTVRTALNSLPEF
jgi:hypothetical protein